jgi:predicted transcriptional regulator
MTWTYAGDQENYVQPRDRDVDRAVARLFAARARQEAIRLNRAGDFEAARRVLMATRDRIERYAGDDPEIRAVLEMLTEEQVVYAAPMAEASRKQAYYSSTNALRSRDIQGRSIRRS